MTSNDRGHRFRRRASPARRAIDWFIALLWLAAVVAATLQQGLTHRHNNFLIFRAACRHLVQGADLYAAYPALHIDFYKYSPTFALLFLPFAFLPFWLAMLLWNALNAGALYVALGMVLPRRAATIARAIVFLDMLGSLQNAQSNALVAALIIVAFAAYERRHTVLGTVAAVAGTTSVLRSPASSLAVFHPRKVAGRRRPRARNGGVRLPAAARHAAVDADRAVRELARHRGEGRDRSRLHRDGDSH